MSLSVLLVMVIGLIVLERCAALSLVLFSTALRSLSNRTRHCPSTSLFCCANRRPTREPLFFYAFSTLGRSLCVRLLTGCRGNNPEREQWTNLSGRLHSLHKDRLTAGNGPSVFLHFTRRGKLFSLRFHPQTKQRLGRVFPDKPYLFVAHFANFFYLVHAFALFPVLYRNASLLSPSFYKTNSQWHLVSQS